MESKNLNPRRVSSKSWLNGMGSTFSQHTPGESVIPFQQRCTHSVWLPVKIKEAACGTTLKIK